jgi:hypothetical protein
VFAFEVFVEELGLDGWEFGFELERHVSDALDGDGFGANVAVHFRLQG